VRARLADNGVVPNVDSPQDFATYLADENTRWERIIRVKGIKVE
jgi:tripartite-type tricarboxylate transporter receptor subunit TctC